MHIACWTNSLQSTIKEGQQGRRLETVGSEEHPHLVECPMISAATAFPIRQTGSDGKEKIRRGEDWLRGVKNSTLEVDDPPNHHTFDNYTTVGRHIFEAPRSA